MHHTSNLLLDKYGEGSAVPPAAPLHVGALGGVLPGGALLLGLEVGLPVRPLAVVRLQVEAGIVAG